MPRQSRTTEMMDAPIQRLLQQADMPDGVVSLGQGVPFFGPPGTATAAAAKALSTPDGYRYSHDAGHPGLRQAIAGKLRRDNDIAADWERNVIATAGANQAFVNAVLAVTDVGDSVVIVRPYYFNHVMAVQLAGCRPVFVEAGKGYVPEVDDVAAALRPDTRAVVTISPNNPTGAVYPPATLRGVNELCADHDVFHISDEPYEHFVYDDAVHVSPGSYDPALEHTVSLFSFSKSYGMSGYRIGAMAVPASLYSEVLKVQDTVAICPPGPSQAAAAAALQDQGAYPRRFLSTLAENRQVFIGGMAGVDGVMLPVTRVAFYFLLQLDTDRAA
ncbi:MAG: aminotransferase class I/II-fold pyridoxal phosphate-dependent enzyme, partial [Thermoplasmatota archaeon]